MTEQRRFLRPPALASAGRAKAALAAGVLAAASAPILLAAPAQADPAPDAATTRVSAAGPFSVAAPDGVCAVQITIAGGAGGDALGGQTQGAGAVVSLGSIPIAPGQLVEGSVGGRGENGGGAGVNGGGEGSPTGGHRGAGGGGYSEVSVNGGGRLVLVGGGGGSGGGHVPAWGHGGDAGVPTGPGVFAGADGLDGDDGANNPRPGGGKGAGTANGGAGGVHPTNPALSGHAGSALQGGNGGDEPSLDGGAGGGGGLYGGGGGASTSIDAVGGAGGGGGSSFVAAGAPFASGGQNENDGGYAELAWQMCSYDLALTKSVTGGVFEPGVPVTYTVTVENLGPQRMTRGDTVTVTDALANGGTLTGVSSTGGSGAAITCDPAVGAEITSTTIECSRPISAMPGAPVRGLDVGEKLTLTYTQELSGNDPVSNTASTTDRGDQQNNEATAVLDPAAPALALEKSASPTQITKAGQTVTYSFDVTNTGNIALNDITIEEGSFSGTGDLGDPTCPAGALAPAATVTCTVDYTATQADVDAGTITNSATAKGTTPGGTEAVSPLSDAEVTAAQSPSLKLVKSADPEKIRRAGQEVRYNFLVTNTGNVTLTDLSVDEGDFSGTGTMSDITCPAVALAPGDKASCSSTYDVTAADVDAKKLTNTATAGALDPNGEIVKSAPSSVKIPVREAGLLPATGSSWLLTGGGALALILVLGGGALAIASRRRGTVS